MPLSFHVYFSILSPRFSFFYLFAYVYTEGSVEDVGLAAGLVSVGPKNFVHVLCNNNRKNIFDLNDVILQLLVFQILQRICLPA